MYYILYEGLKIESNEPVYCTMYSIHALIRLSIHALPPSTEYSDALRVQPRPSGSCEPSAELSC